MEPQATPPHFTTPQPSPAPLSQPPTPGPVKAKNKAAIVLSILMVIILAVGGTGVFALMRSLSTKQDELAKTQTELTAAKKKLENADSDANKASQVDLQKQANDTKRKNDLARFMAAANEYAANNQGQYPSTEPSFFAKDFEATYITGKLTDFTDPTTKKPYTFTPVAKVQTPPGVTLGDIQYQWPGKCSGTEFEDVDNSRQAAARLILESGQIYCIDS